MPQLGQGVVNVPRDLHEIGAGAGRWIKHVNLLVGQAVGDIQFAPQELIDTRTM